VNMPRLSIRTMIALVVVVAGDYAVLRYVLGGAIERPGIEFGIFGVPPTVNVLALGLYRISRRGDGLPFLFGFEAFGLLAVLSFAGCSIISPVDWLTGLDGALFGFFMEYEAYRALRIHADSSIYVKSSVIAIGLTSVAALFTPPRLFVALAGGMPSRGIARRRALAPAGDPSQAPDARYHI